MRRLVFYAFLTMVFSGIAVLMSASGDAQTLNDAVDRQLSTDAGRQACSVLLDGDSASQVLTGPLRSICERFVQGSGTGPSTTTGGGAGTATTLPGVVEERMKELREDEDGEGASTGTAVTLGTGLSLFISGEYEELDREVSTFEDGYESDIWRLTAGADIPLASMFVIGLALDTSKQDGDFEGGGDFDSRSYGITVYGSVIPADNAFIQVYGGYTSISNERQRTASFTETLRDSGTNEDVVFAVEGDPDADYDADQYSAGLSAGYDFAFGAFTIGPRAALDWNKTEYDIYSEGGDSGLELTFHDDEVASLQSSIGFWGSVAGSTDFGVVTMQQGIYWKHQFDQDQRDVDVSFVYDKRAKQFSYQTEAPDRNFFEYDAGISFVLPRGIQAFLNFRTLFGHRFYDSYAGTAGIRVEL